MPERRKAPSNAQKEPNMIREWVFAGTCIRGAVSIIKYQSPTTLI